MRKIWKTEIDRTKLEISERRDRFFVHIPKGAIIRDVGVQECGSDACPGMIGNTSPVIWYEFETDKQSPEMRPHYFRIFPTGGEICGPGIPEYIGTFQIAGFVGHIFEISQEHFQKDDRG